MAKNDKVDITFENLVSEDINIDEISEEEKAQLNYETALRYVNIAEHMKQFEDQDKYYLRAQQYLKKAEPLITDKKLKRSVILRKFAARSEGKIALYNEACSIRDKAKTPSDYASAQALFERIHKYEEHHPLNEKWTDPEVFAAASACNDSAEQAEYCAKMVEQKERENRRKSLFASFAFLAFIGLFLYFTRTIYFPISIGYINGVTGDYNAAWHYYLRVYLSEKATEEQKAKAFDSYHHYRYLDSKKCLKNGNENQAYKNMKVLGKHDYKDSRKIFVGMEKERVKNKEIGEIVGFGNMDWIVMEKKEDKVLLYKKTAKADIPFDRTGKGTDDSGDVTWENSYVRQWLNNDFLKTFFYEEEAALIVPTKISNPPNPVYGTKSGKSTTDHVYLLSYDEFMAYQDKMAETTASCWWLRTAGAEKNTMMFINTDRSLMDRGYDVTSDRITLKPAIWVNVK